MIMLVYVTDSKWSTRLTLLHENRFFYQFSMMSMSHGLLTWVNFHEMTNFFTKIQSNSINYNQLTYFQCSDLNTGSREHPYTI